ncbi:MAG: sulfotransferase [Gammaproteobacteria bacterium]|nr:sulfotransferase [Gammaproteobacteria bacterium]
MEESIRRPQYREPSAQRARLDEINELLVDVERELEAEWTVPTAPLVFIIGAPRSGTTLASQILAHSGTYAWVNNFVARFWSAPLVGVKIARAMGLYAEDFRSTFASAWGTTEGWLEPHEFGYFWNRFFDLGQDTHKLAAADLERVDGDALRRAIDCIQAEYDAPLVLKNNTWCTLQAAYLAQLFPRAIFVACFRDLVWLAQSLLMARRERLEDPDAWWSVRPATYQALRRLPVLEQVVGQARDIQQGLEAELAAIPAERVVRVDYASMCHDPAALCRRIAAAAGIENLANTRMPESFPAREDIRISPAEWQTLSRLASNNLGAQL